MLTARSRVILVELSALFAAIPEGLSGLKLMMSKFNGNKYPYYIIIYLMMTSVLRGLHAN